MRTRSALWLFFGGSVMALTCCRQAPTHQGAGKEHPIVNRSIQRPPTPAAQPAERSIMQPDVQPSPVPAPKPVPLLPLFQTVRFPDRSTHLDAAAKAILDRVLADPIVAKGGAVTLRGSSDTVGSQRDNRWASLARARSVAAYMVRHGIAKDRIATIGLGAGRAVAPNVNLDGSDNPGGRALNRRVDIEIDSGPPRPVQ